MKEVINEFIDGLNAVVRPLCTLMLVIGLLWGFVTGLISSEAFLGLVSMVLGFWFQEREHKKAVEERKEERKELINLAVQGAVAGGDVAVKPVVQK